MADQVSKRVSKQSIVIISRALIRSITDENTALGGDWYLVVPLVFKTSVGLARVLGGFDSHSPPLPRKAATGCRESFDALPRPALALSMRSVSCHDVGVRKDRGD